MFYRQRDPILNFIPVEIEIHILMFLRQQDPISKFIPVYIEKRDNFLVYYWVRMAGNRDQDPFKYQISELVHIHGLAVLART